MEAAGYLEIPVGMVQAAIGYYGAHTAEIDQEIEANDQQTAAVHAAYLADSAQRRREPGAWRGQVSISADFVDLPGWTDE